MSRCAIWVRRGCGPCAATVRELVPELEAEGVEVEVLDVRDHPCRARDEGVDYLPTVIFEDGARRVTCRGYPPPEFVDSIFAG